MRRRVKLTEVFIVNEADGSHVREVKLSRLPKPAIAAFEEAFEKFFKDEIKKTRSSSLPDDLKRIFSRQRQRGQASLMRGGVVPMLDGDGSWKWFTDGHEAVGLAFDDRFVSFSKGSPVDRTLDDSDRFFWDGSSWRTSDERFRGSMGPLTAEDDVSVKAMLTAHLESDSLKKNSRIHAPQMKPFLKKMKSDYEKTRGGDDDDDDGGGGSEPSN
jgi:hypothetical protein